jgi:hypothetical protein
MTMLLALILLVYNIVVMIFLLFLVGDLQLVVLTKQALPLLILLIFLDLDLLVKNWGFLLYS